MPDQSGCVVEAEIDLTFTTFVTQVGVTATVEQRFVLR